MLFYSWAGTLPDLPKTLRSTPDWWTNTLPNSLPWAHSLSPAMWTLNGLVFQPIGKSSDGLVPVESTKFGKFIGAFEMDHIAAVNTRPIGQLIERTTPFQIDRWMDLATLANPIFDKAHPASLFCEHANRLMQNEGRLK